MRNSTKNIALTIALALTFLLTPMQARSQEKAAPEKVRAAIATSSLAFLVPFVAKDRASKTPSG